MLQNSYYKEFAQQFAGKSFSELVTLFNSEVGNRGWVSMRAWYDCALIDEFRRRNINLSAISDGPSVSFAHHVKYDECHHKLVPATLEEAMGGSVKRKLRSFRKTILVLISFLR